MYSQSDLERKVRVALSKAVADFMLNAPGDATLGDALVPAVMELVEDERTYWAQTYEELSQEHCDGCPDGVGPDHENSSDQLIKMAEAWDEGFNAYHEYIRKQLWGEMNPMPDNPYRREND